MRIFPISPFVYIIIMLLAILYTAIFVIVSCEVYDPRISLSCTVPNDCFFKDGRPYCVETYPGHQICVECEPSTNEGCEPGYYCVQFSSALQDVGTCKLIVDDQVIGRPCNSIDIETDILNENTNGRMFCGIAQYDPVGAVIGINWEGTCVLGTCRMCQSGISNPSLLFPDRMCVNNVIVWADDAESIFLYWTRKTEPGIRYLCVIGTPIFLWWYVRFGVDFVKSIWARLFKSNRKRDPPQRERHSDVEYGNHQIVRLPDGERLLDEPDHVIGDDVIERQI